MMLSNGCSEIQVSLDDMVANEISVRHGRRGGGTMLSFTHAAAFLVKRGDAGSFQDHLSLETAS